MTTAQTDFRCPRCKAELAAIDEGLRCTACTSEYRVRDGIVDLRCGRMDYYFNPVPREEMNRLIDDAEHEPWPTIVRRFLGYVRDNPDWLDDLIIDSRYAWKLALELPPDARFLDLGCGLGNLTKNIAPHVGEAVALDLTWERLRFAKRRFARFNAGDRITVVAGGDGPHLPFPDASFDCVALSGVLEWVADFGNWQEANSKISKAARMVMSIFGASNPREMQIKFLQEIRRILKPDGQLFVAIENRLNYEYFGKRPDHHTVLWFGSLLPRFAANLYSIAVNQRPYRTYTYSISGLQKLFQAAGFARQEFLGFLDGYTHLNEILPLKTGNADFWHSPRAQAFVDRIRRSRQFVPAYGIISTNSAQPSNTLLRRVVNSIQPLLPADHTPLSIRSCRMTGKEKTVLRGTAGGHPVLISIPCNPAASAAQARHYGWIERAREMPNLSAYLPRALAQGTIQKLAFHVESELAGAPLREELHRSGRTALLADVAALLRAMNPTPALAPITPLDGAEFERLVERPLREVMAVVDDAALAKEVTTALEQRLRGLPVRRGLFHGDFSVNNLFAHEGRVNGLIDWEDVLADGLPIVDVLNYLDSVHRAFNPGMTLMDTIPLLAKEEWPVDEERRLLADSYAHLGDDSRYQPEFAILYWLYHVRPQLDFSLACNRRQIKQRIELVARELLRLG